MINKDFTRPLILIIATVLILGVLAALIPSREEGKLKIKPFKWFGHLLDFNSASLDSSALAAGELPESQVSALSPFTRKLESATRGNSRLRIAYFGDSIIEGDLITARLRHLMQSNYGGSGVGLVPITSIVAGFRQTIRHSFSRNWETISFMSSNREHPLGFGGYVYIPRNYYSIERPIETAIDTLAIADSTARDSLAQRSSAPRARSQRVYLDTDPWVEYSGSSVEGGASSFSRIRLFYSKANSGSYVDVSYDGAAPVRRNLNPGQGLQILDLSGSAPVRKIRLSFSAHDPIHLYGVSFDEARGAYVDNISVRGFSGLYFSRIPEWNIRGFQQAMDYDLVILQYGENVSNPKITDYSFYHRGMNQTLAHLKAALPNVPILMISAHDRSIKRGTEYVTSPDIPYLVNTQAQIAADNDAAFWNLLEAMGGLNSMRNWVHASPSLASKDFTHFNRAGANKIADMLFEILKEGQ